MKWKYVGFVIVQLFFVYVAVALSETNQVQPGTAGDPIVTKSYVDQQMTNQITSKTDKIASDLNAKTDSIRMELNAMIAANVKQSVIDELKNQSSEQIQEIINAKIEQTVQDTIRPLIDETMELKVPFQSVKLVPGQQLFAKAGTEFVVRSGKATVVSGDKMGLSNLTEGKEVLPTKIIPLNHLLMSSKETRGIANDALNKSTVIVFVRGGYELK